MKVGMMSFEMAMKITLGRMCLQAAGSGAPSEAFMRKWSAWNRDRMCYYDHLDTCPTERVLGALLYMAEDMGSGRCGHG